MSFLRRASSVLTVSCLLLLASCNPTKQPSVESVRVGYLPHHGFLPLFVAIDQGFDKSKGININAIRFETSPTLGTSFVNGQLDAVPISTSVALGIESRDPGLFKIFAVSSETKAGYLTAMVAMPGKGIQRVEDLHGRTIGVFPGPAASTLFGLVLKKHGLTPRVNVQLLELPPPAQLQALASGQVDALATYEPIATQAVLSRGARKFLPAAVETEVLSPTQGGLWIVSQKFVSSDPQNSERLIMAIYEAIDFIRQQPKIAAQSITKYTGVSSAVASQLPVIPYSKLHEIDLAALQQHADIMTSNKVLSKKVPVAPLLLKADRLQ